MTMMMMFFALFVQNSPSFNCVFSVLVVLNLAFALTARVSFANRYVFVCR